MMRSFIRIVGSRDSISWVTAVVVFIGQLAGSFLSARVNYSDRFPEFSGVTICSLSAMLVVLGIGKLVLNALAIHRPQPDIPLLTFIAAVLVRAWSFDYLLQVTGFSHENLFWLRIWSSGIGLFVAMVMTAYIVSYAREFQHQNAELLSSTEQLFTARANAESRLEERQSRLVEQVRFEISSALTGSITENTRDELKSMIDDVVRPLSYRLAGETEHVIAQPVELATKRVPWHAVYARALDGQPFHPAPVQAWLGTVVLTFLIPTDGLLAVPISALIVAAGWAILALSGTLWRRALGRCGLLARTAAFVAAIGIYAASMGVLLVLLTSIDESNPVRALALFVVVAVPITVMALFGGVTDLLRESNAQLLSTQSELRREIASLNASSRQMRKRISRVIHGPIQDAISAAIFSSRTSPGQLDQTALDTLRNTVNASLDQVDTEPRAIDLRVAFAEMVELWQSVCAVSIHIRESDCEQLATSPESTATVIELVREACSNAIRHGEAQHVSVAVRFMLNERELSIDVTNDGLPLPENARAGLGSQMFDDLCVEWSRTQDGPLVRLDARIPMNPVSPARIDA